MGEPIHKHKGQTWDLKNSKEVIFVAALLIDWLVIIDELVLPNKLCWIPKDTYDDIHRREAICL